MFCSVRLLCVLLIAVACNQVLIKRMLQYLYARLAFGFYSKAVLTDKHLAGMYIHLMDVYTLKTDKMFNDRRPSCEIG